jgi:hypothetical protein
VHPLIDAWRQWLHDAGPGLPPPTDGLPGPPWLLALGAAASRRSPFLIVGTTRLLPPDLDAVARLVAGERVVVATAGEHDVPVHALLRDGDLLVDDEPADRWLERLVDGARRAPRQLVAGAARARTHRRWLAGDVDTEAPARGVRLRPIRDLPTPPDPQPLAVTPYAVRDGERVVLRGWWLAGAARLPAGEVAALTLHRDEVVLDRAHPDFALTRAAQLDGTGPVKVPSTGQVHVVDAGATYRTGIRLDADALESVRDGALLFVRRAAFRAGQWGTLVLACHGRHLTPIAKLEADVGRVFEADGRVVGAEGFEILGLDDARAGDWTPDAVGDALALEKPPPPAKKKLPVELGDLELRLTPKAAPPEPARPDVGDAAWTSSPGPTGAVLAASMDHDVYTALWLVRPDGTRVDLPALAGVRHFTFAHTADTTYLTTDRRLVAVDHASGALTDVLTLPRPARDLAAAGPHLWALLDVHRADSELYRYDRAGDGWREAVRFPVRGLDTIRVAPDGRLVALTIDNAPKELAFTLLVAVDRDGAPRSLGRLAAWASALWRADGHLYLQLQRQHAYRVVDLDAAVDRAAAAEPRPLLALVYDVPTSYGQRAFFPRYEADWAYIDAAGHALTPPAFTEAHAFEEHHAVAGFQGGWYRGLVDRDGRTALPPHYAWIGPADAHGLRRVAVGAPELLTQPPAEALWGVLDGDLQIVVPCEHPAALDPTDGHAVVKDRDGAWWLLDARGAHVAGPLQGALAFRGGLAPARADGAWGYVDAQGDWAIRPRFELAAEVHEGRAAVRVDGLWAYLDPATGELLGEERFQQFTHFHCGLAAVARGGKWGHVDRDGRLVGPGLAYARTFKLVEGRLAAVQLDAKRWAYVDAEGRPIGADRGWTRTWDADEGVGVFQAPRNQSGFVLPDGTILAEGFSGAYAFRDGLAAASRKEAWGFVGHDGAWSIPPQFEAVGRHREGRCPVRVDRRWGYLDRAGEVVIAPEYAGVGDFHHGRSAVRRA